MLLTGTYHRSLDDKLRLSMPKRIRDSLNGETAMFITPGTDGSLAIYPSEVFDRLGEQLSQAPPVGQDVRSFSRLFYGQAESLEIDGQGRVRIPTPLARLAALSKDIVLVGVRDHLEVWDRDRWESYLDGRLPQYDQIAERALGGPSASEAPPSSQQAISPKIRQEEESPPATQPRRPR